MWFNAETVARLQAAIAKPLDPATLQRIEAEKAAEARETGTCQYCDCEIAKNDGMKGGGWSWESELLVGFCDQAGDGKHKPKPRRNRDDE